MLLIIVSALVTVIGKGHKGVLVTVVDRATRKIQALVNRQAGRGLSATGISKNGNRVDDFSSSHHNIKN
ncbi:MAG: hypothetical protein ACWIPH_09255 [Ostreibacterium sp.]